MTVARLSGRVAAGSMGPMGFFIARRDGSAAGQGAWGRAVRRSQACTMAVAQGQVAAILRWRRRPLRVRRAAAFAHESHP
jgi:hypothetical protein